MLYHSMILKTIKFFFLPDKYLYLFKIFKIVYLIIINLNIQVFNSK